MAQSRRAWRSRVWWGCRISARPVLLLVHRARSGHPRQAAPKVTLRLVVIRRVTPFGQVTVPAASSTVNSSRVNPPATAGRSGIGLITGVCPAAVNSARASPVR